MCARTHRCMFQNSADTSGSCVEIGSIDKGTSIYAKQEEDTFVCSSGFGGRTGISGTYQYLTGAEFLSGDYVCGEAEESEKAGSDCETDSDCPSANGGVNARCLCGVSSTSKICDVLPGNSEWRAYFTAAQSYISATKHCHNARGYFNAECEEEGTFREMMCKKAKAKNYIENKGASSCAARFSNPSMFPGLNEVQSWCDPDRVEHLLNSGLGLGLSLIAVLSLV